MSPPSIHLKWEEPLKDSGAHIHLIFQTRSAGVSPLPRRGRLAGVTGPFPQPLLIKRSIQLWVEAYLLSLLYAIASGACLDSPHRSVPGDGGQSARIRPTAAPRRAPGR